ncbi:sentrin-specific protease 1-like [Drosophila serrata]|uniref:sentrin-specific protease 1-like n=1 Tax=Drosophila serrata TaxID=7274 RepID=UPI000A1D1874|nr:sentrin-specific protease 1-like [Drosophila serrata]
MVPTNEGVDQKFGLVDSHDAFLDGFQRINQFIKDSLVYQQANEDYDKALSQMDIYSFLIDLERRLLIQFSEGDGSQDDWSLFAEILKTVDSRSSTELFLTDRLLYEFKEWCKLNKTVGSSTSDSESQKKRSPSVDDSPLITTQNMVEESVPIDVEMDSASDTEESSSMGQNVVEEFVPDDDQPALASDSQSSPTPHESTIDVKKELTYEDNMRVMDLLRGAIGQVIVKKFNIQMLRCDICTLYGSNWLNDNVINFYMELLNERSKQNVGQLPTVHAMNSFFLPRLMEYGYGAVRRWTRKVDLFSKHIIPIPVHFDGNPSHWSMVIIDLRHETIRYYDSLGKSDVSVLVALKDYLERESMDKRKQPFDTSGFKIDHVKDAPHQYNGNDCGVFCCMYAEFVTRDAPLTFDQSHMVTIRKRMILEIADGKLWT